MKLWKNNSREETWNPREVCAGEMTLRTSERAFAEFAALQTFRCATDPREKRRSAQTPRGALPRSRHRRVALILYAEGEMVGTRSVNAGAPSITLPETLRLTLPETLRRRKMLHFPGRRDCFSYPLIKTYNYVFTARKESDIWKITACTREERAISQWFTWQCGWEAWTSVQEIPSRKKHHLTRFFTHLLVLFFPLSITLFHVLSLSLLCRRMSSASMGRCADWWKNNE